MLSALALAEELEARPEQAHVCREYGNLLAANGRTAEAQAQQEQAAVLYQAMGMTF